MLIGQIAGQLVVVAHELAARAVQRLQPLGHAARRAPGARCAWSRRGPRSDERTCRRSCAWPAPDSFSPATRADRRRRASAAAARSSSAPTTAQGTSQLARVRSDPIMERRAPSGVGCAARGLAAAVASSMSMSASTPRWPKPGGVLAVREHIVGQARRRQADERVPCARSPARYRRAPRAAPPAAADGAVRRSGSSGAGAATFCAVSGSAGRSAGRNRPLLQGDDRHRGHAGGHRGSRERPPPARDARACGACAGAATGSPSMAQIHPRRRSPGSSRPRLAPRSASPIKRIAAEALAQLRRRASGASAAVRFPSWAVRRREMPRPVHEFVRSCVLRPTKAAIKNGS